MNRANAIRIAASFFSNRHSATRSLCYQVTQFSSRFSYLCPATSHCFHNTSQKLLFSSKPYSMVDLLLREDWSAELENELRTYGTKMTHPTVVDVLKKLDKDPKKACGFFNWVRSENGYRPNCSVYCLMLRIASQNKSLGSFWAVLKEMTEQGFCIEEETYINVSRILEKRKKFKDADAFAQIYKNMLLEDGVAGVVKRVSDVVLRSDWNDDVKEELRELKLDFLDNLVMRVFKELREYPLKALNIFRWVGSLPGFEYTSNTYHSILRVLAREESIEEFWNMVEEIKDAGYEMDIDTYIKISRQFQKLKMMEDAVKLYELMMDRPFKPPVEHCSMLLRSIAGSDNPDLAFRISRKYEVTGHSFSKAVYDGIHRSLTRVGCFDEAEKIVKAMRDAGYEPDNITYSQLVFGLCKAKRLEEACKVVMDDMEAQGCRPDIKTWTILIKGHFAANEVDKGLKTYLKMVERKYKVDANLLNVLINGLLGQDRIKVACEMFVETVDKARITPLQATYKNLIGRVLETKKFEEAMNLLRLMKQQKYPPFTKPFVQYISKFGTAEDAAEFLESLAVKQYPTSKVYINLFKALLGEGRDSEANDLLQKCPHHIRKHSKISELFS